MPPSGIRRGIKIALDRVRTSSITNPIINILETTGTKGLIVSAYWSVYTLTPSTEQYEIGDLTVDFKVDQRYEVTSLTHTFRKERDVLYDFITNVQEGDVIYDVGGNLGVYTCFGAAAASDVHVITFEPAPWNVDRIEENLELNKLEATVYETALSDSSGTAELSVLDKIKGEQRHSIVGTDNGETITVNTRPGDEIAGTEEPVPNIVKIDVEGAEDLVIDGLYETLSDSNCRLVYCEVHHNQNQYRSITAGIEQSLESMGFELNTFKTAEDESVLKAEQH